jgi:signal peptide peptidase SppA
MAANSPQPSGRRSSAFVIVLATIGAVSLAFILTMVATMIWSVSTFSGVFNPATGPRLSKALGNDDFIGLVRLEGPIDATSIDTVLEDVDTFAEEPLAKAILLEVNSPGGAVVASQELYDRLLELRKNKPIVAYYRDVAASGAYYATASASWIIANRGSMVGSIGVIMQSLVLKDLLEWAKLKPQTLKTGSLKDAGSPLRDSNPSDEAYLNKLLTDTHAQFMDDVQKGRSSAERQNDLLSALTKLKVESAAALPQTPAVDPSAPNGSPESTATSTAATDALALRDVPLSSMDKMRDGRVVLGNEAYQLGLIDAVGSRSFAIGLLRKTLRNDKLELEEIMTETKFESMLKRYLGGTEAWAARFVRRALETPSDSWSLQAR